jgi:hypothetical protein
MTAPRKGPRVDSQGYRALEQLHKLGGEAHITTWMKAAGWTGSIAMFDREIVGALLRFQVVTRPGAQLVLTDSGREHLGVAPAASTPAPAMEPAPGIPVSRYVAPVLPLSAKHRPGVRVMRPGAFDYRDIPSLQADQRIPFQSSLQVKNG